MPSIRWVIASYGALAAGLASWSARAADGGDAALAQALFEEARRLMAAGRHAEACPKLAESQRLDPGGGTLLNLAICHEAEGKTATAWSELKEAAGVARRDGRDDRARLADARLQALEPRLARLVLRVPSDAPPDLVVTRDGQPIARAAWGLGVPVDPGPHEITATAPGRVSFRRVIELPRDGGEVVVSVPALAPIDERPVRAPGVAGSGLDARRASGVALVSVGAVALGVGTYFGIRALHQRSDSDAICDTLACSRDKADAVTLNDQARRSAVYANLFLGGGILASGLGTYLLVSGPRVAVGASAQGGGVRVEGRF